MNSSIWVKIVKEGKDGPTIPSKVGPLFHLALGPGWDRSFRLDGTEDNEVCETCQIVA